MKMISGTNLSFKQYGRRKRPVGRQSQSDYHIPLIMVLGEVVGDPGALSTSNVKGAVIGQNRNITSYT